MADENKNAIYALLLIGGLIVGILGGFYFDKEEIETITETVEVDKPVDTALWVPVAEYAALSDAYNALSITSEDIAPEGELSEQLSVREAAISYFLAEWKDEFEWSDGNDSFELEDLLEDGIDVYLEDYPNVDNQWNLIDSVDATEVDIKDNEWEVSFTVEIEIDGTDVLYDIECVVEEGEADDLVITQQ